MSNQRSLEPCSLCSLGTAELTHSSQIVGKGETQVIVENVPMYHCRHCGGTYLTRATALALQEIRLHPETCTQRKSFATATLEMV